MELSVALPIHEEIVRIGNEIALLNQNIKKMENFLNTKCTIEGNSLAFTTYTGRITLNAENHFHPDRFAEMIHFLVNNHLHKTIDYRDELISKLRHLLNT